ncbi:isoleucine--tRNA ligase [Enterobacterales bacterium endosymbiont of Anomoneura mori]|uniref:isoleucine--tRNA ligase n=1 Tax=Enterobacterales bacterium endosymbiont of Anomoneura mori TaxID=3132096 RepID=UPI00399D3370
MKNYKNTLNLPKTNFPIKNNFINQELNIISYWSLQKIYKKIRESKKKKKTFILHDGPLYANGNIHIGHAVNKIIKDIIIKSKGLEGFDAPFVPGWDCHGLPIELKVEEIYKKKKLSNSEFRDKCRIYVNKQISNQKKTFIRLGILADWENPYLTMDFNIEANIILAFKKIINSGYLKNGKKPIYWCINCQSSLSDAEIEYHNKKTLGIYVLFNFLKNNEILNKFNIKIEKKISLIIWTTTPWTLASNKAIAIHPDGIYQIIKILNKYLILSKNTVNSIINLLNIKNFKILSEFKGIELQSYYLKHPFMNYNIPIILSNHIDLNTGSGIVHIAPSHGLEDYIIGKKYSLDLSTQINKKGYYILGTHSLLDKKFIFDVDKILLKILKNKKKFLFEQKIFHKYPYCWRHKTKVIYRITKQWFIKLNKTIRNNILKNINQVKWLPNWGKTHIENMIKTRPDWCISRQRIWGVPMTLFVNKKTFKIHPLNNKIIDNIVEIIKKKGIQAWWDLDKKLILGNDSRNYFKINDVLDVWFDSGTTYYTVINKRKEFKNNNIDLYVEGSDQYRGWFMSSIITSNIIKGIAPYKEVLVHGFTVDNKKQKMSKSIGNIINPLNIIKKFSCDVLRLWVAYTDYTNEIIVSDISLQNSSKIYKKIRNTIRFLLSNLNDFNPNKDSLKFEKMLILDLWALNYTIKIQKKIKKAYNQYNFNKVVKYLINFCSVKMGAFYFDIIKDRQYTNKKNSISRKSCQTAMYHIIESLVRWISPILSFTSNEIWNYLPGKRSKFIFTEEWYNKLIIYKSKILDDKFWNEIIKIKNKINKKIENLRIKKKIGSTLEANIEIYANNKLIKYLKKFKNELNYLFIISNIKLFILDKINKINNFKIFINISKEKKCNRCWHYTNNISKISKYIGICNRCIINLFGLGENRKFI